MGCDTMYSARKVQKKQTACNHIPDDSNFLFTVSRSVNLTMYVSSLCKMKIYV